jgi:hypothetical protein
MEEKFIPMVECLQGLGVKKEQVGLLITRFPQVLGHSVEEKLVPTLAFLQVRPCSCNRRLGTALENPPCFEGSQECSQRS